MKLRPARLLFPALRWDDQRGYELGAPLIEAALRRGAGGFCIFGGTADAVAELTYRTQSRADVPLLFAADLERGAGQQFTGATPLPPLAALGALDDAPVIGRAAELTAREALALGVNWLLAPVADVDLEPRNPIVGTRAFGADPEAVARHVAAWVAGAQGAGALACAKHFPGHGRTTEDSHAVLPRVDVPRAALQRDLEPFRAAVRAGVASVMTAHVLYEALDAQHPATLSARIAGELLRTELGFEGIVVTDALVMQGVLRAAGGDEATASLGAVRAGCDAILYPGDFTSVADALEAVLPQGRVAESSERIEAAALRCPPRWGYAAQPEDRAWARAAAGRALVRVRGTAKCPPGCELLLIDDDAGGPFAPPARDAFPAALHAHGLTHEPVARAGGVRPLLIALFADIRAWKGSPELSVRARAQLSAALAARGDATVVLFGHPRLADAIGAASVIAAWGGEPLMQQAAADWLHEHAERTIL